MKSSSLHTFTCDKGNLLYKTIVRILYFPLNWYNNRKPLKNTDPELSTEKFVPQNSDSAMKKIISGSSPSRKWSDLFLMNTEWEKIHETLKTINVLDLGCGTGNYYFKLQEYSGNKISSYVGVDISKHENLLQFPPGNVKFINYDGKNLLNLIPLETNIIFSQSAIEHFQEDLTIFKQIKNFCEMSDRPIYQLHMIPARECLKLYRFHGVRQYTPRTISKITKLFIGNYEKKLFILGGKNSNEVHKNYISKTDKRSDRIDEYEQECRIAFNKDIENNGLVENANFYALLIKKL